MTVTVETMNLNSGMVTLRVVAASPTPSYTGGSPDCIVAATAPNYVGTTTLASASVIVYIPASVGNPHDPLFPTLYTSPPIPVFMTAKSVPALDPVDEKGNPVSIPYGDGYCEWCYGPLTTITVWDQFNHPLDAIYDGASVYEGSIYIMRLLRMEHTKIQWAS